MFFRRSWPCRFLVAPTFFSALLLAKFDYVVGIDLSYFIFLTTTSGAGIGACFVLKGDGGFFLVYGDLMESVSMMEEFVSPIGPLILCGPIDLNLPGSLTNFFGFF